MSIGSETRVNPDYYDVELKSIKQQSTETVANNDQYVNVHKNRNSTQSKPPVGVEQRRSSQTRHENGYIQDTRHKRSESFNETASPSTNDDHYLSPQSLSLSEKAHETVQACIPCLRRWKHFCFCIERLQ